MDSAEQTSREKLSNYMDVGVLWGTLMTDSPEPCLCAWCGGRGKQVSWDSVIVMEAQASTQIRALKARCHNRILLLADLWC